MGLGDLIASALERVAITPDSVSDWLGTDCRCAERKEKLNMLGNWAARVISGKVNDARRHLETLMGRSGGPTAQ